MKRKNSLPLVTTLFLLLLATHIPGQESLININKIEVQPGLLTTRLILQTDALLPIQSTFYAPAQPQTLVIDVGKARTAEVPAMPAAGSRIIENIRIEKAGASGLRFNLQLKEKVPYRILSRNDRTVIELNGIQRNQGEYVIDPDIQALLAKRPAGGITLNKLDISDQPDRVNVRARLDEGAVSQVFALDNPSRLVVDLFDTVFSRPTAVYPVSRMGVDKVRIGQFQLSEPRPITRMVFDIREPGYYSMAMDKGDLVISFFKPRSEAIAAPAPIVDAPRETPAHLAEKPVEEPKVEAKPVSTAAVAPAVAPPAQEAVEEKAQATRPDDKFKPKAISVTEEKYTGEIISLQFKDADLRDVVLYLADFANLNVVFDPDVRGTVTCDLQAVPWDQALDIILRYNRMGKSIEGNVLRIAPVTILTREDEELRKLKESKELAGPLDVKTITLSYSKAKDVSTLLKSKVSTRGEIVIDDRTNTLIISEVREKMALLEKLISVLDTPTPQVSIEARIIEATATFTRNLGIQWGYKGIADSAYGNQTSLSFPNSIVADGSLIPTGEVTKGIGGPLGGYAVNLPAASFNTAVGFSFANVLNTFQLDVALTALESSGNGRIISSPKVTTQNNQPAEIVQGRQIPVQTVANFTVTTRYVNAALELRATPQITAEGTIIMTIEIQNNAADFSNLVNGIPPITTQSAKTTVMVPDGGTTVIGGIYRTEDSTTRDSVPFLGKIPILGNLFRSLARTKQNRELLIFITPRIIK
jgi:type IV pilus secretin PilQ/predicted competence protein